MAPDFGGGQKTCKMWNYLFPGPLSSEGGGKGPIPALGRISRPLWRTRPGLTPLRLVRRQAAFSLKSSGFGLLADPSGWQGWRYNFQK
jgi:hypothetical protein